MTYFIFLTSSIITRMFQYRFLMKYFPFYRTFYQQACTVFLLYLLRSYLYYHLYCSLPACYKSDIIHQPQSEHYIFSTLSPLETINPLTLGYYVCDRSLYFTLTSTTRQLSHSFNLCCRSFVALYSTSAITYGCCFLKLCLVNYISKDMMLFVFIC